MTILMFGYKCISFYLISSKVQSTCKTFIKQLAIHDKLVDPEIRSSLWTNSHIGEALCVLQCRYNLILNLGIHIMNYVIVPDIVAFYLN